MVTIQILVAVFISVAVGKKMPPGIWGPWKSPERAMFSEIPYPFLHEDDYKPVNFSSCGGTIYNPTVISTGMYPFGNQVQNCKWIIRSRPCFFPKLTLMSSTFFDGTQPTMNVMFNDTVKTYRFAGAAPGTVYQANRNYAEVIYDNRRTEQRGFGFQMTVDYLPSSTPECMAGFTFLPDSTCVPINVQGESYLIRTPGFPTRRPPANFSCKHAASLLDEKFQNVEINITSALRGAERLEVRDLLTTTVITSATPVVTVKTAKPYFILYAADTASSSAGYSAQVTPSAVQAPAPCNTILTAGPNNTVVSNPITSSTSSLLCVAIFKSSTGKLNFDFTGFSVRDPEIGRIFTKYLGMGGEEAYDTLEDKGSMDFNSPVFFVYKPANPPTPWSFTFKQI